MIDYTSIITNTTAKTNVDNKMADHESIDMLIIEVGNEFSDITGVYLKANWDQCWNLRKWLI